VAYINVLFHIYFWMTVEVLKNDHNIHREFESRNSSNVIQKCYVCNNFLRLDSGNTYSEVAFYAKGCVPDDLEYFKTSFLIQINVFFYSHGFTLKN
jgi:hypothetical protein